MAGFITPLPIMLQEEEDRKTYEKLEAPKTIVCRFGYLKEIAELSYSGDAKPGCGSKMVIRTKRGIEMAEMLTTVCNNSGCSKSISREEMLQYIENSGGKDYPYFNQGKVLRVATIEDLNEQAHLDVSKTEKIIFGRKAVRELELPMKLVDVEQLLGGERIIFYYTSEDWVDFRELVRILAAEYQTRIEMCQVNARNEARLVADYEKCGQHCCCKQFLKVLKPVSMRSAKVQKATLDPTKISGRCGRLMCCLRYEDQTYTELQKRLPRKQTIVETPDGIGTVIDTQILTQLVLIRLDNSPTGMAAYPLENITILTKDELQKRRLELEEKAAQLPPPPAFNPRPPRREPTINEPDSIVEDQTTEQSEPGENPEGGERKPRRRRRRKSSDGGGETQGDSSNTQSQAQPDDSSEINDASSAEGSSTDGEQRKKRRRRRRRRGPRTGGEGGDGGAGGGDASGGDGE